MTLLELLTYSQRSDQAPHFFVFHVYDGVWLRYQTREEAHNDYFGRAEIWTHLIHNGKVELKRELYE